ncbi:hypothetical protein GQ53DRAFT_860534 [Thozetella sp. PMI_491]|nr:hypothetical protein GQ53DRAFT_860534 [Thozetella sp. PMI_491]
MAPVLSVYSFDEAIASFFANASVERAACDAHAKELVGGTVDAIKIQGDSSYSVYAGPDLEYVVQFRRKSMPLNIETCAVATKIHGGLAPRVSFEGQIGEQDGEKEPIHVYLMPRIRGMTYLDFTLASKSDAHQESACRKNLMIDIARFFAQTWKQPQNVPESDRNDRKETYEKELRLLLSALPSRFHAIIQACLDSLDTIISLPWCLLHTGFGMTKVMVDEDCHLVGVVDWTHAEVSPFGLNLNWIKFLTGTLHFHDGWSRYDGHDALNEVFWATLGEETGGLSEDTLRAIRLARAMGLLLEKGFNPRGGKESEPQPIIDDDQGRYNLLSLDGFLVNPITRFEEL